MHQVISVSELASTLRLKIKENEEHFRVRGEISEITFHKSGIIYFSLTDGNSTINCICLPNVVARIRLDVKLQKGLEIIVLGNVDLYQKNCKIQFSVNTITLHGLGSVMITLEKLKKRLASEGLFDESNKLPLPLIPSKIGVITSPTGAVIHDIEKIISQRFPSEILLYPSQTQGMGMIKSIINGIKYFNHHKNCEVIIIARGGGSFEDLFHFNDEDIVREVSKSKIPIISAIGHETDYTLLDFVADYRAPTPSAAAKAVVPDINELKQSLLFTLNGIKYKHQSIIETYENFFNISLTNRSLIAKDLIQLRIINLHNTIMQLKNKIGTKIIDTTDMIMKIISNIRENSLIIQNNKSEILEIISSKIAKNFVRIIEDKKFQLLDIILETQKYDYQKILSQGYIIVKNDNGHIMSSINDFEITKDIKLSLKDGQVIATVTNKLFDK